MTEASPDLVLCSTARLARSLRNAHARAQQQAGLSQWQPLQALTLSQWLESVTQRALLSGSIPPQGIPRLTLSGMAERLLWEQVIAKATSNQELFDVSGMAQSAMEANALMQAWDVRFPDELHTDETRQFLRWRGAFRALCQQHDALEETRMFELQISLVQHAILPPSIHLAGFDRISPQELRLFEMLEHHGSTLHRWELTRRTTALAMQQPFDEAEAECRAAVLWVQQKLAAHPAERLAIVVPQLAQLRPVLQAMLDDALHPQSLHAAHAEMPRIYDFSLGAPLTQTPVIATALALLRLACNRHTTQQETGALLREAYWSASISEADARAILDKNMRRKLPATLTLEQLLRQARKAQVDGLGVAKLVQHLEALQKKIVATRLFADGWVSIFTQMLEAAHWPGERTSSSFEHQAQQAWKEVLQAFAELGPLLGKMSGSEALRRLSQLCRERIFQPESVHEPQVQIMGMLEAAGEHLDGVWVMGMNDHIWPPPAQPNALLPAEVQRKAGTPGSCSQVQAEFAQAIHERLLHSAPEVIFSWARRDGERELRPSPLLQDIEVTEKFALAQTLAEQLAQPETMQWLQDHQAPAVTQHEKVRGGAALFQAQAICPAWGYFQFRLGARELQQPVDGLDSMARGNLLHAVLQAFWNGRDSTWLAGLDEVALQRAVKAAVEAGIKQFSQQLDQPLPANFAALEKLRLEVLLNSWLQLERERPPFAVQACEQRVKLEIQGISVELTLDRVDVLAEGELVVLDYKTGSQIDFKSWAEDRITEPQLPIYAALVLKGQEVAAVCFARVRAGEYRFIGISRDPGTLPDVKGLEEARKLFGADKFPEWNDLLQHWCHSLEAIADEIKAGEAAVRFKDEDDLAYCEVKPLLRLPERKLQLERGGSK